MNKKIMTFPCDFPIKAIGKPGELFEGAVISIIRKHVPEISEGAFSFNSSKQGNYLSITATIKATSQAQIDAIYYDLTSNEHVIWAL